VPASESSPAAPSPPEPGTEPALPWHALPAREVLLRLESDPGGISASEADERRAVHGPNVLLLAPPASWRRILAAQFKGLIVVLLAAAALVALTMGEPVEAAAIAAVLLVNAALGFWMEWRARQEMEALRRLQLQEAVVLRDGAARRIDARDLVPGDVIEVEAGTAVPADARLFEARELTAVEAPLTGESAPVAKAVARVGEEAPLAERTSMLYKGTLAAAGSALAVVVATGRATEVGRVMELVAETEAEETPLERRLGALGRRLVGFTLGIAAVVTGLGILRGESVDRMVETGLALAVAAVPEGLPVVATLALAVGMRRMARRHALVRRLPAVETLGSATVVCTDKTGTLTAGEMTLTRLVLGGGEVIELTGAGFAPVGELRHGGEAVAARELPLLAEALVVGALANHATVDLGDEGWKVVGDPTEAALLVAARKAGFSRARLLEERPRVGEVPFSSERRWMASFHRSPGGATVAYVKGAPGRLVELSRWRRIAAGGNRVEEQELDETAKRTLLDTNRELAGGGLRVLALARRELPAGTEPDEAAVVDLTFLGFAGIIDPPAAGTAETVAKLRRAGVRTVMITGDQAVTAEAVARQLGLMLPGDERVDGREVEEMPLATLGERAARAAVFSRTSPAQKLRIVDALQARGEIVAMLGDGVNDAPALKSADVGVAMGARGTDVAKETAAVVLQDDRFETVAAAVEEGRVIFDNIRKFIFYLFSCNLAEVLVLFLASLAGLPLPLLPLQILWLNLLTDVFPALALAVEPAEPDVMERPPRDPASGVLSRRFLGAVSFYGGLITAASLAAFAWGFGLWGDGGGLGAGGADNEARARTLAFATLAFAQLAHVVDARSSRALLFSRRLLANRWAVRAVVFTAALQLAALYLPGLSGVLDTVPLGLADWAVVVPLALAPLLVGQAVKALRPRQRSAGPL
jgi:P-type Ca2+ transporter type 2C